MRKLNIAIVGCGQVGQALIRQLKSEYPLALVAVCDVNKPAETSNAEYVSDYRDIIKSDNVDIVVETLGGTSTAYDVVTQALQAGKHVVTSNAALMATQGHRLMKQALAVNGHLKFEAALHGDAGWARSVSHQSMFNGVSRLYGIFSACSNYVLMRMKELGETQEEAYKAACEFGMDCGDMEFDLSGREDLYRLMVLRALAFGVWPDKTSLKPKGIASIQTVDVSLANRLGCAIKLLSSATPSTIDVEPCLVEESSLLGHVHGQMMALVLDNEKGGLFVSAVDEGVKTAVHGLLSDLLSIAMHEKPHDIAPEVKKAPLLLREDQKYYVRYQHEHSDSSQWPHTIVMERDVSDQEWTGAIVQSRLSESEVKQALGMENMTVMKVWS